MSVTYTLTHKNDLDIKKKLKKMRKSPQSDTAKA